MTQYHPTDVVRLLVERDTAPGEQVNLVQNPNGDLGGWGWLTPSTGTTLRRYSVAGNPWALEFANSPLSGGFPQWTTENLPVTPGKYVTGRWRKRGGTGTGSPAYRLRWEFYSAVGALVSSGPQTGLIPATTAGAPAHLPSMQVPAGAVAARLRADLFGSGAGGAALSTSRVNYDRAVVVQTDAAIDPATISADLPSAYYTDVFGSSAEVTVERAELDTGTLRAVIYDPTLDPSQNTTVRPGRRVKLQAYESANDWWHDLFTGKVTNGQVVYSPAHPNPAKRARLTLTAVDAVADLGHKRPQGVATVAHLPYVLEGCGVPWSCNGDGNQVSTATVVATNDQASALDQVALTRDSVMGYAWVDRSGILQAWDRATIDTTLAPFPLSQEVYNSDVVIDYDTARCINSVTVTFLRYDATTQGTEEIAYGPYRDEESIRTWGVRAAEFKIQWAAENEAAIVAFALAVLAANATPEVRVNEVTVPLNTETAVLRYGRIDLYDRVQVTTPTTTDHPRVTSIKHVLTSGATAAECKWLVTYGFAAEGGVASPTFVPAPTGGADGKSFAQLIRPVGEVSMWFGAKANCPAGWLVLDGSTFDGTTYPQLATLLGSTTLPNLTDRMPVGAGTKALGTSGGAAAVTLNPAFVGAQPSSNEAGGYGLTVTAGFQNRVLITGPAAPAFSILPPWRALWFIIRAV